MRSWSAVPCARRTLPSLASVRPGKCAMRIVLFEREAPFGTMAGVDKHDIPARKTCNRHADQAASQHHARNPLRESAAILDSRSTQLSRRRRTYVCSQILPREGLLLLQQLNHGFRQLHSRRPCLVHARTCRAHSCCPSLLRFAHSRSLQSTARRDGPTPAATLLPTTSALPPCR